MGKITDNNSQKAILESIRAFDAIESVINYLPFLQKSPAIRTFLAAGKQLKSQSSIVFIPDKFNEKFSSVGWIAFESMNLELMEAALNSESEAGIQTAEKIIADYYNEENVDFLVHRLVGHPQFRKRLRLINLAKEDYFEERYHACIPLLLALIDGLANDISKHVGLFAESSNPVALDSIAGHATGLQALTKIFGIGRNKTNEDSISIPYRNGILHGRELAFDNRIVAAKCWGALFALKDWANAVEAESTRPAPPEDKGWAEIMTQIAQNTREKKALEQWSPREIQLLSYLPATAEQLSKLPLETPERAVGDFLDHWMNRRYGLMANQLPDFKGTSKGKQAGETKEDFKKSRLINFSITSVEDVAPIVSLVKITLVVENDETKRNFNVTVRTIFHGTNCYPALSGLNEGSWRIIQNVFAEIIYGRL